jgi:hypothetical protein
VGSFEGQLLYNFGYGLLDWEIGVRFSGILERPDLFCVVSEKIKSPEREALHPPSTTQIKNACSLPAIPPVFIP